MSPGEDGLIGIPFPEHSNELLCHLNDQRRTGLLCDLTLTSHGSRYPTHRSVMAAVSLYFRRIFGTEEGGGESGTGFSECQLDCVAPDALDALLEFAYTATLTIPSSGMRDVLRGAQLLGIQCVADACREILGETDEIEAPVEEYRVQQTPPQKRLVYESAEKISRRKNDKKKVKKLSSNHTSVINPPSPISHPSSASDSLRSLPSTQPPSPERDEHHHKSALNGDQRTTQEADRGTALNGGLLRWLQDPPHSARPTHAPRSKDKLSEEDDTEGFVEDGIPKNTVNPTSLAHRDVVASAAVGGRKRKSQTPQQCPVCQKIIHGAGKLPRHMRTHTGEKPFQCSACGVRFTRNDKLKIHMRKHTGERPYPCPHCPARFLHSYDLKNHLSLHSGARPFECPLCHKAFAREDHLQRHRKGHSCLEVRTRRPRRGPEDEEVGGDGTEPSASLESLSLQGHSSGCLPSAVLKSGNGPGTGPPLMYQDETERERSIALQALAQLAPHRLAAYPALFFRDLELRGRQDDSRRLHALASQRDQWADNVDEDVADDDVEEE